jgi:hypothetical protein
MCVIKLMLSEFHNCSQRVLSPNHTFLCQKTATTAIKPTYFPRDAVLYKKGAETFFDLVASSSTREPLGRETPQINTDGVKGGSIFYRRKIVCTGLTCNNSRRTAKNTEALHASSTRKYKSCLDCSRAATFGSDKDARKHR